MLKRFLLAALLTLAWPALADVYSISNTTPPQYIGASTDTKPTRGVQTGAIFWETDTLKTYVWKGTSSSGTSASWVQHGQGVTLQNCLTGECNDLADDVKVFFVAEGDYEFEEVSTSATDQSLGTNGSTGDYLSHCNCQVTTSGANGTCGIEDGTNTAFDNITSVPASTPIGNHLIKVGARATTAAGWEVTTGSAATMQCYGWFDTSGD